MKICHITSVHKRYDVRIFNKMCRSLANAGYDVTLLVADQLPDEVKDNVKIVSTGFKPKNRFDRFLNSGRNIICKAKELDCEIYHLHDPELLPVGLKLKKLGKKVIFDSHEIYGKQIREKHYLGIFRKPAAWFYEKYEAYALRRLDAVIGVTPQMEENFSKFQKNIVLIANYPVLKDFSALDMTKTDTNKNAGAVIYAGGLTENRGITVLAEAIKQCDAKLILCGPFQSETYQQNILASSEKIDYRGVLPLSDVYDIYKQSDIGICTLLKVGQYADLDTFGIKVFEYMAAGLPCILSDTSYNVAMTEKYKFGICCDPGDADAVADAIQYLLSHPEEAQEMGQNGRRAIETEFNWSVEEKKLLKLYRILE